MTRGHEQQERPESQLLGDEHKKIDGDIVDDVTVVDDQHDRLPLGFTGENGGDVLEHSRASVARSQQFDQRLITTQLTHDRRPGPAPRTVANRSAGHPHHAHGCVPCTGRERLRERGLAEPL